MKPWEMMRGFGQAAGGSGGPTAYAKWNASDKSSLIVLSNSDRTAARSGTGTAVSVPFALVRANIGKSSGKWYFEISSPKNQYSGNGEESAGLIAGSVSTSDTTTNSPYVGITTPSYGMCYRRTGGGSSGVQEIRSGSARFVTGGTARTNDGYIGIAVDLDAGKAWAIINGTWTFGQSPTSTPAGTFTFTAGATLFPAITIQTGVSSDAEAIHTINCGQDAFLNVAASAFDPGGVLAGFNPGWYA